MNTKIIFLIITFLLAAILPFIDYLATIEVFYLIIPLALGLFISAVFLIIVVIDKREGKRKLIAFCFVPVFVLTQFLSTYTVDLVQGVSSEYLIDKIESVLKVAGTFPSSVNSSFGIQIEKSRLSTEFTVTYSRGFLVREVYDSRTKSWKSYGWND